MNILNMNRRTIARAVLIVAAIVFSYYFMNVVSSYREFHHSLTVSNNVRLADRRVDVMYRLGSPTHVLGPVEQDDFGKSQIMFTVDGPVGDINNKPSNTRLEDYSEWVYEKVGGLGRLTVGFDTAGLVESISWYSDSKDPLAWGPFAGIRNGDLEENVLKLGNPSINSIRDVTKTIEYSDIGLEFSLAKGRAYTIKLTHPTKGNGAIFLRFLHTLL